MDIREITPRYSVSPQINPEDLAAIKAAGFTKVICNRPDEEIPASHQASVMQAAADRAGLEFFALPLTHQTMTPENVSVQMAAIDASEGPVLAYCASGTRCSVIWALAQVGQLSADEILTTTMRAGYDLSGLRPRLEQG
ncbi:TIGR01244 family sulfur transferase [Thalassobius sp. S69A]|uniref:TIGR01244 family sulfur transferase n=1 Tax=unclassified Thalassovita TaxID=2619711 RepID=UPI000C0C57E8|nr:TIGR01244 family phosphatase [Paracoccaceae bacterium]MBT25177.1 TIGR01244 family phosphatase [Paracoccaceae bacterium]